MIKIDMKYHFVKKIGNSLEREIMIATFRIDERLIHGQVIATWLKTLGITHLIVANDECANNPKQQAVLKMAVPSNVKCLIKGVDDVIRILKDPRCDKMTIMLICGIYPALMTFSFLFSMSRVSLFLFRRGEFLKAMSCTSFSCGFGICL